MAADGLMVRGKLTRIPNAYSQGIDASALTRRGPGLKQLVLIGEAEGGAPVSVVVDDEPAIHSATSADKVRRLFRGGPLRAAGQLAFGASADSRVGEPARVLCVKVNPSTRASAILSNGQGAALELWTREYGAWVNQAHVQVGAGTTKGYLVTATLESTVEVTDDVGGDAAFTARYDSTGDFTTARLIIDATGARVTFTDSLASGAVLAAHTAGDHAVVASASAYDTVQQCTVYGTNSSDEPISETVTLAGASAVTTTLAFKTITGARLNGATRGIVTVKDQQGSPTTVFSIAATLTADHTSGEAAEVVSASAADVGIVAVIYGYTAGGQPQTDTVVLNGTTPVAGTKAFGKITATQLGGAGAGNITVRSATSDSAAFTVAAGSLTAGINVTAGIYTPGKAAFAGRLTARTASASAGTSIIIRGRSTAGVVTAERLALNSTTEVTSTTAWSQIDQIELGGVETGIATLTSGTAIELTRVAYPYVQQVVDAINARPGFHATAHTDGASAFPQARLDFADASIRGSSDVAFGRDLDAIIAAINAGELLTATRSTNASGPPNVTPAPVYMVGGTEGTTTAAHWQAAFDALKTRRDVRIVPVTTSAAVRAMAIAHNRFMEGLGGDERNAFFGLDPAMTKAQIKAAVRGCNDRNSVCCATSVRVYDENGVATSRGPEYLAVMLGAMQCGAGVAVSLINKAINVLSVSPGVDWTPADDAEEMIELGLTFIRRDDDVGFVVMRDVTTWRQDDNPVFSAMGANDSVNESMRRVRRNVGTLIGESAFDGRASTVRDLVITELERQVADGVIKAFDPKSVVVTDAGNTFPVEYNAAAMEAVVFVPITMHVVRMPRSAAA